MSMQTAMVQETPFEKAKARMAEREAQSVEREDLRKLLSGLNLHEAVEVYERKLISEALRITGGKITEAAQLLGVSYQTLSYALTDRYPELRLTPKRSRRSWKETRR